MFKNLIWDFDGTLIDTYSQIFSCYSKVLEYYGKDTNTDKDIDISIIKDIFRKRSGKEAIQYIEKKTGILYDDFLNKYTEYSKDASIIKTATIYDGTIELLDITKKKDIKNFIVTNRDETIVEYLKYFNLEEYFDDIVYIGRYDINDRKPDTKGYKYIIDKYNLDLNETLSIGDTDLDIITSQKLNLKTCLIRPIQDYSSKPDFLVNDAFELMKLIIK